MPLTRSFKDTVMERIRRRPAFRDEMLVGAIEELLCGEVDIAKGVLRDVINATVGFENLGKDVGLPPKSLMRMFGPNGNPQAKNLFAVIVALQRHAGVEFRVVSKRCAVEIRPNDLKRPRVPKNRHPPSGAVQYEQSIEVTHAGFAEAGTKFRRR